MTFWSWHPQKATVERYSGKGTLGLTDGVKRLHLLPLVPNFAAMVNRLEELQERSMPSAASARLAPVRHKGAPLMNVDTLYKADAVSSYLKLYSWQPIVLYCSVSPAGVAVTAFEEANEDREAEQAGEEDTASEESDAEGAQGLERREESLQVGGMAAMRRGSAGVADSQNFRKCACRSL